MRKDILKYGKVVTDRVNENAKIDDIIEKYGNNPNEYIDDILELMRNKKLSIGDIPKAKQTKELLIKYLDRAVQLSDVYVNEYVDSTDELVNLYNDVMSRIHCKIHTHMYPEIVVPDGFQLMICILNVLILF